MRDQRFANMPAKRRSAKKAARLLSESHARKFIRIKKARCPECKSDDLETKRSSRRYDGSQQRSVTCRTCGETFFVIVE